MFKNLLNKGKCLIGAHQGDWLHTSANDCAQTRVCQRCGVVSQRVEHAWNEWSYITTATCEQQRICRRCEGVESRTRHIWGEPGYLSAGACDRAHACARCREQKPAAVLHVWKDWEYASPRDCGQIQRCDRCGMTSPKTRVLHELGEWQYSEAQQGAVRGCSRCAALANKAGEIIGKQNLVEKETATALPQSSSSEFSPTLARSILKTLGNSIFYEEQKGNFAEALEMANASFSQVLERGNAEQKADMVTVVALVNLMWGQPAPAAEFAGRARKFTPSDVNRCLLALSYEILARSQQFNSFPDGNGAFATEILAREQNGADLKTLLSQWNDLFDRATDPPTKHEAWLTVEFVRNQSPARGSLTRVTPAREQTMAFLLRPSNELRERAAAGNGLSLAAFADWAAADLHRRGGDLAQARRSLDGALRGYNQAGDRAGEALCLMTLADWECAPFSTPLAWNLAIVDSSQQGSFLQPQHEADEFKAGAEASYAEAEELFEHANSPRGLASIQLRYGYQSMLKDDWAGAARHAIRARNGFAKCGDGRGFAIAAIHLAMCQLSGAGAKDVDAEAIARTVGQWGKISGSFSFTLGLGILLNRFSRHWMIRRGHYERALACSRAARTLFGALGAKVNVAQCEFDQGSIYQAVGERKSAATLYERALDDYTDAIKAYPLVASNLRQRAVSLAMSLHGLYQQQSDGEGMERIAGRLRHITEELPAGKPNLEEALADFVSKLSVTASGAPLESPAEMVAEAAERATLQAVRQAAERVIEQSSALAPLERWRKARDEGNESLARSFLDRALAAARKIPDDSRHALEATVLQARKDYKQAAEAYRRHLAAGGANAGLAGDIAGVMQQFGGEDGQHVASLQQQRTHLSAFMFFVNVRHYDEARTHLVELERITGKGWWENDQQPWVPLIKCAEMYEGLDDPDRQMECYDRAIEQLEARRDGLTLDELKVSLASEEGAQYLYFRAARAAIRAGGGARAFDYAERGKARALLDQMASARSESSLNESLQARKWRRINSQLFDQRRLLARVREAQGSPETGACIDPFERRIAELQSELRTVERDLARTNPNFHEAINPRAGTMSFDEVRAALPRGTAMIKHFFLEGDLLAWAITRDGRAKTYRAQIDANALSRTIRDFHRACESRGNYERLAENLSDLLLGPFAETIRASERLIFVPYGAAHTLPFHVLPFDGQPLGASYSISFLPSASAMRFLKKNEADTLPKKILVVGNPTGDLPFAETEAEFVAGLFERSELLAGGEATEAAVRERIGKYPLLHFATHGNLSESSPLDSSIALAGGERLTVLGLMDLRLRARLVVLSACSTAKGETTGGDDVLGLTRGLLAAGARSAIVSLWPVNDHSTAIFMTEFYRHLQTGDAPDDALRKARNHLRHLTDKGIVESLRGARAFQFGPKSHARRLSGYGHPYYWAPFILVG